MNKKKLRIGAAAFAVLLVGAAALGLAGRGTGASAQEPTAVTAVLSPLLQYQGRLSNPESGAPLPDGSYPMIFRLYPAPTGGPALWAESKDVSLRGGLFSTLLGDVTPLDQGLFTGQALWLGIKVGADEEAAPRQPLVPVAYALGLVPGAVVASGGADPALTLNNSGGGPALAAAGPVAVDGDLNVSGSLVGGAHKHSNYVDWYSFDTEITNFVDWYSFDDHIYGGMHHERYTDAEAVAAAENSPNILNSYWGGLHTADAGAHHPRYSNSEAVSAIKAADGSGSGLDADTVDGQQASEFASSNHGHGLLPIAAAHINNGAIVSATPNLSLVKNGSGIYTVTIQGHYYDESYVSVSGQGYFACVPWFFATSDGKLRIWMTDTATYDHCNDDLFLVIFRP